MNVQNVRDVDGYLEDVIKDLNEAVGCLDLTCRAELDVAAGIIPSIQALHSVREGIGRKIKPHPPLSGGVS